MREMAWGIKAMLRGRARISAWAAAACFAGGAQAKCERPRENVVCPLFLFAPGLEDIGPVAAVVAIQQSRLGR